MTPEMLLALMLTMRCHTTVIDIPERQESVVTTVCVKVQVKPTPVVKKAKPAKKRYAQRKKKRRRT